MSHCLQQAYDLCVKVYRGRHRASGETRLAHAGVAQVLVCFASIWPPWCGDADDIVDHELSDVEALRRRPHTEVADVVESLACVRKLEFSADGEQQAETSVKCCFPWPGISGLFRCSWPIACTVCALWEKSPNKSSGDLQETLAVYAPPHNSDWGSAG
ncbi:MAG: hypothetical protein R2864_12100 [Syntrophotaleaceae bacterium]